MLINNFLLYTLPFHCCSWSFFPVQSLFNYKDWNACQFLVQRILCSSAWIYFYCLIYTITLLPYLFESPGHHPLKNPNKTKQATTNLLDCNPKSSSLLVIQLKNSLTKIKSLLFYAVTYIGQVSVIEASTVSHIRQKFTPLWKPKTKFCFRSQVGPLLVI